MGEVAALVIAVAVGVVVFGRCWHRSVDHVIQTTVVFPSGEKVVTPAHRRCRRCGKPFPLLPDPPGTGHRYSKGMETYDRNIQLNAREKHAERESARDSHQKSLAAIVPGVEVRQPIRRVR